jgi:hypothetical protein
MMTDVRAAPVRRRSARWLIGFPAGVGALVAAVMVAIGNGLQDCRDVDESRVCLGNVIFFVTAGIPAAIVVTWLVLALGTDRWRAPVVTIAGGWLASIGWSLSSTLVDVGPNAPTPVWLAAVAGGAGFGAVALACVPGLRRSARICVIAGLVAVALGVRLGM